MNITLKYPANLAVHIGNISPAISRNKVQWPLAGVAVLLAGIVIGWRFW